MKITTIIKAALTVATIGAGLYLYAGNADEPKPTCLAMLPECLHDATFPAPTPVSVEYLV